MGSKDYNLSSDRGPGAGQPKHNAFVGDVCLNAGAYVPKRMIDEVTFRRETIYIQFEGTVCGCLTSFYVG